MIDRRELLNTFGMGLTALMAGRTLAADDAAPGATEGLVDVLGGQLHYQAAGEGDTVVLLHKLGGRAQEWRRIMPALAQRYRVLAFDLVGHGQSTMHGPPPYVATQEAVAAQLMAALDELGAAPPYRFVGSSLGGCVAVVCAALWPEQVAALVTVGSALGGATNRAQMREMADRGIADGHFDRQENPLPRPFEYVQRAFGLQDRAIAQEQNDSRAEAGRWIAPASRGVGRFDYLEALPRVSAPMLLVWGERGNYGAFVDPSLALLSDGRKAMVANSGAFPHEEAPAATAELVLSFFGEAAANPPAV